MASGEVAQGQITSGFSPWDWNTFRKASQEDTDPDGKRFNTLLLILVSWEGGSKLGVMKYSQGLAPSATISIRNEAKLVSLCSRWAIMAQCRSRHFTKATRAAREQDRHVTYVYFFFCTALLKLRVWFTFVDVNPLDPGERTSLHHRIGNTDSVYPVHHSLEINKPRLSSW